MRFSKNFFAVSLLKLNFEIDAFFPALCAPRAPFLSKKFGLRTLNRGGAADRVCGFVGVGAGGRKGFWDFVCRLLGGLECHAG